MSETNNDVFKLENLYNVKGKVALVTGGGSGIGLMATQALAVAEPAWRAIRSTRSLSIYAQQMDPHCG